jgi:hypothetical protein
MLMLCASALSAQTAAATIATMNCKERETIVFICAMRKLPYDLVMDMIEEPVT